MKLNYTIPEINRLIRQNKVLVELKGDSSTCYTPMRIEIQCGIGMVIDSHFVERISNCKIFVLKNGWQKVHVKLRG